jgi:uncharacterized small protein (DUF1192 family)
MRRSFFALVIVVGIACSSTAIVVGRPADASRGQTSVPSLQQRVDALEREIQDLKAGIAALRDEIARLRGGSRDPAASAPAAAGQRAASTSAPASGPGKPPAPELVAALPGKWSGTAVDRGRGTFVLTISGVTGSAVAGTLETVSDSQAIRLVGPFGGTVDGATVVFDTVFAKGTPVTRGIVLTCDMHLRGTLVLAQDGTLNGHYRSSPCDAPPGDGTVSLARVK